MNALLSNINFGLLKSFLSPSILHHFSTFFFHNCVYNAFLTYWIEKHLDQIKRDQIRLRIVIWKKFNWLKPGFYAPVRMPNIWWVLSEISNVVAIFLLAIFSARSSPAPDYLYVTSSLSRKWYVYWHSKLFALTTLFATRHFEVFFVARKLMILLLEHASMMWYKVMSPAPLYPLYPLLCSS